MNHTPTNAAKAASVLHHTWGVDGYEQAVLIYDRVEQLMREDKAHQIEDFLEELEAGCWEPLDHLPVEDWWENVEALALSIDTARLHFLGDDK